jgi:hypothetical protein
MTTAKDLMPPNIAGTAEQSGALFADNGTLRDPRSAGGENREHEYFGQCRRHLPGRHRYVQLPRLQA